MNKKSEPSSRYNKLINKNYRASDIQPVGKEMDHGTNIKQDVTVALHSSSPVCSCPNGGKDRGVIIIDTKAHLPACRLGKNIAKNGYETLSIVEPDKKSYSSINSSTESLGGSY